MLSYINFLFTNFQLSKKILFPGDSEIDQLFSIFRTMGTPDETCWPGISQLPDYKPMFPRWKAKPLSQIVPQLDDIATDLFKACL